MKHPRIRHSDQEWLQLIQECRTSGMPDNAWCEQHGIKSSTFYNAVTRLRKKACEIPEAAKPAYTLDITSRQDVVQIDICPEPYPEAMLPPNTGRPALHLDNSHTIELFMDGVSLKISNTADPVLLEKVLRMVRQASC